MKGNYIFSMAMLTIDDYSQLLLQHKPDLPAAEHDENGALHFLQLESALLQRLMYKNCNQHKNTKYFGRLQQIRSRLRKLDFPFLERLLAILSQISTDEMKSHILGILFVHFKLFEEILELCAVAQPALSQLIEISNFMPFAIAMIDLQQVDLSRSEIVKKLLDRLGELPLELKSNFDIFHNSAKTKSKRSRHHKSSSPEPVDSSASVPTAPSTMDDGEELGEMILEPQFVLPTQPAAPKKPEPSPTKPSLPAVSKPQTSSLAFKDTKKPKNQNLNMTSLTSPDRVNPAPKRKQPDVPEPVESAAKRPKVVEVPAPKKQDTKPQPQIAARPPKQQQTTPAQLKPQNLPKKPTFSHSNPSENPNATSFFSNKPAAPAAPAPAPKKAAPSKAAKSMDQLFASLISSGKKKK